MLVWLKTTGIFTTINMSNIEFELDLIPNFTVDLEYSNIVTTTSDNSEQRVIGRGESRLSINYSNIYLRDWQISNLRQFYNDRKGEFESFKVKIQHDCSVTNLPKYLSSDNLVYTRGLIQGSQLYKLYSVNGINSYKTITRPDVSTISIYDSFNNLISPDNYSIDEVGGGITVTGSQIPVWWEGDFFHHVRFEGNLSDVVEVEPISVNNNYANRFNTAVSYFQVNSLILKEIVENRISIESIKDFQALDYNFNLSYKPQLTQDIIYNTYNKDYLSGIEVRDNRSNSYKLYSLNNIILDNYESEYLICYFKVCRGRLLSFLYNNELVRFNQDTLSLNLELSVLTSGVLDFHYNVSTLEFKTFKKIDDLFDLTTFFNGLTSDTYVELVIDNSGSMNTAIPFINNVKEDIRNHFFNNVFSGDAALTDSHVIETNRSDERWLKWCTYDPGTINNLSTTTKSNFNKLIRLLFINESSPYNPDHTNGIYLNDRSEFITTYDNSNIDIQTVIFIPGGEGNFDVIVKDRVVNDLNGLTSRQFYQKTNLAINAPSSEYINFLELNLTFTGSTLNSINNDYRSILNSDILPYVYLIKIEREDGVQLGFTTYDKKLILDNLEYNKPTNSNNTELKIDLSVNSSEINTIINDGAINDGDIINGLYDNAEITIYLANVGDTDVNHIIYKGLVGEITKTDVYSRFEVTSKNETLLNRKSNYRMSPTCNFDFGDSNCSFDVNSLKVTTTIQNVINSKELVVSDNLVGTFTYGILEFKNGFNINTKFFILNQTNSNLKLFSSIPYPINVGDIVELTPGCDKSESACKSYNNFVNFGGFPTSGNFMPGNDKVYNPLT